MQIPFPLHAYIVYLYIFDYNFVESMIITTDESYNVQFSKTT